MRRFLCIQTYRPHKKKNIGTEEILMIEIKKRASFVLGIISFLCSLYIGTAEAATRLTPAHLYDWARTGNITRLQQFKRYINLQDRNHNTALCLAQKAQDSNAYTLLLKFGASTRKNKSIACGMVVAWRRRRSGCIFIVRR